MKTAQAEARTDQQVLEIAMAIDEMAQSRGWQELCKIWQSLLDQEMLQLSGQKTDGSYYKKIGFLQMYKFCKDIPNIIKDKKIRDYLLSQGRVRALTAAVRTPMFFFEGIMKGQQNIKDWLDQTKQKDAAKDRREFHQENLK